jgi:hypothetical protein
MSTMYKFVAFAHPIFARIEMLGACDLREDDSTGEILVSLRPATSRASCADIRNEIARALPDRRVVVSIRAVAPRERAMPARCNADLVEADLVEADPVEPEIRVA